MRTITVTPTHELALTTMPDPQPQAGDVVIRVAYAGLNRADIFQRQGRYPAPSGDSPLLGLEVSGWIAALSPESQAAGWRVGDALCALTPGGGYAELVRVPAAQCWRVPEGWRMEDAAALPEALMTLWLALFQTAGVVAGQCVLIQGGTSGIGSVAIPMLTQQGMRVFATASNPEKCATCVAWGAEAAFVSTDTDCAANLRAATGGGGMHAVLDMLGGTHLNTALAAAARGGHIVSIAFLNGARSELNLGPLLTQNLHWHGVTLRSQPAAHKASIAQTMHAQCWPWLQKTSWRPTIDSIFALEDAAKAHQRMEERLHLGKILLRVGASNS